MPDENKIPGLEEGLHGGDCVPPSDGRNEMPASLANGDGSLLSEGSIFRLSLLPGKNGRCHKTPISDVCSSRPPAF